MPKSQAEPEERIRTAASLGTAFVERVAAAPNATVCLTPEAEGFYPRTAQDFAAEVDAIARAFAGFGLRRGDRVALMAPNGPFWAAVDLAALRLGLVVVPLYPDQSDADVRYILEDSAPALVCAQGRPVAGKLTRVLEDIPSAPPTAVHGAGDTPGPPLHVWDWLLAYGEGMDEETVSRRAKAVNRSHLATLVYTSGTTGWPKGVELTHGNLLANLEGILATLPVRSGDRFLSFLPLAHIFERTAGHLLPYLCGAEVAYARGPRTVPTDLPAAAPTVLLGVPRLFQLFHDRIEGRRRHSRLIDRLLRWATAGDVPRWRAAPARWLLSHRLRKGMGGRIRLLVSGGAPLVPEVAHFFASAGLPVLEGYGQTETAPVVSVNPPEANRPGTVGRPLPNVEVRMAGDGEILVRGGNVMRGYWNQPEATAAVLDGDWLRTGDIGHFDPEGYLTITDRKKDLLVSSAGKNIAPQRIELRLAAQPTIEQAVVFGDRQSYLAALIVPDWEVLRTELGRDQPPDPEDPEAHEHMRRAMRSALADLPHWEQARRFRLLADPFSQETGELTPTLKIKRRVVAERYADDLAALFEGGIEGD